MMSSVAFVFCGILAITSLNAEPPTPSTVSMKNDDVKSLVHSMTSDDRLSALSALDRLNKAREFDLIALNFDKISPGVKNAAIDALIESDVSSPLVVNVLLQELKYINQSEPPLNGGEDIAVLRMTNKKLVAGLSKKAGIPVSDSETESIEALSQFILKVEKYLKNARE
jgi:hypothetical protein